MYRIPLFAQLSVLLLVGCIESQQRLQVASVRFHILVVDVNIVQILLLFKYLLCCTLGKYESSPFASMFFFPLRMNSL